MTAPLALRTAPVAPDARAGAVASLEGARFAYGGRPALDGVSLALRPGEIFALLGPNGAGKSTLLRALCGQLRLAGGTARVGGADPWRDARARAAIGLVPQEIALYPKLTVRENLEVFADLAGLPAREVRGAVGRALGRAEAEGIAELRVETLSGGNQRRANVAVALLAEPRLLVLDEPTVGIDAEARRAVQEVLRGLSRDGTAVLIATHDLDQAEALADRVGILVRGRLLREGPPAALLDEAFGAGAQEVAVLLAREADAAQEGALERLGLRRSDGPLHFAGLARTAEQALRVQEALRRTGLPVQEVRARRAGLAALLVGLLREEGGG